MACYCWLFQAIPSLNCIFCTRQSRFVNIDAQMEYMSLVHGFRLPDHQFCCDLRLTHLFRLLFYSYFMCCVEFASNYVSLQTTQFTLLPQIQLLIYLILKARKKKLNANHQLLEPIIQDTKSAVERLVFAVDGVFVIWHHAKSICVAKIIAVSGF